MSNKISRSMAHKLIFEFIDEAHRSWGDNVEMVAYEILSLADQDHDSLVDSYIFSTQDNLDLIVDILNTAGGVKAHQAKHCFVMKVGF